MEFEITIGDATVPGRLPLMPRRYRLITAHYESMITAIAEDDDTGAAAFEAGQVTAAALGLCWDGEPLGCQGIRDLKYDWGEYGELVLDVLLRRGHGVSEIVAAARDCMKQIGDSLPTPEEVEEATDPTEAPAEECTPTMSPSA